MNDRPSGNKMRQDDIDAHLKKAFEALTEEAVPKRFADLLDRMKAADEGGGGDDTTDAEESKSGQPQAQSAGGAGRT